jgi:transcriptional regulator with XRE-family HTH domain
MREILKELMDANGDNAYSLEEKSKVPQPTIQRFLTGLHGDPRSTTVRKLAAAYGLTESQLRGHVPLIGKGAPSIENQPALTTEQKQLLAIMGNIEGESRRAWLIIGKALAKQKKDRRRKDRGHNPERRLDSGTYGDDHDMKNSTYNEKDKPAEQQRRKDE